MSQLNSSATRRPGLRARHALWLVVLVAALSSCADLGSTDAQQPAPTTQLVTQADESDSDSGTCEPRQRAHARAEHRQDRQDRTDHRKSERHQRMNRDEADENENENERDENDNEADENEPDENDNGD